MKILISTTMIFVCLVLGIAAQRSTEMSGRVTNRDGSAASGVVLTIGNYSVTTDREGNYKMTFLRPGVNTVAVSPPRKPTRTLKVTISPTPMRKDFLIDW
jgi:carboxypeptidase family protein